MRNRTRIAGVTGAGLALTAGILLTPEHGTTAKKLPALSFQREMMEGSVTTCGVDGGQETYTPVQGESPLVNTIGFVTLETMRSSEPGKPMHLVAGATIKILGNLSFQVATSDDKPKESTVINLGNAPYVRMLAATPDYSAVITGRLEHGDKPVFDLTCLPNSDYFGPSEPPAPTVVA